MRLRGRLPIVAACLLALAGCLRSPGPIGVRVRERTRFESEWKGYLELARFKSLAVAGDLEGLYVSGFAHASADQERAVEEALRRCERRRLDRRIAEPCRTYAVGNDRVPDP